MRCRNGTKISLEESLERVEISSDELQVCERRVLLNFREKFACFCRSKIEQNPDRLKLLTGDGYMPNL